MKLNDLLEMEPQHCSDPNCDGEITFDETNKDYECMKCGKPAKALKENLNEDNRQQFRQALSLIAAELVSGAHLDEYMSGEVDEDTIVSELLDGRWLNMLGDEIRDQLIAKRQSNG